MVLLLLVVTCSACTLLNVLSTLLASFLEKQFPIKLNAQELDVLRDLYLYFTQIRGELPVLLLGVLQFSYNSVSSMNPETVISAQFITASNYSTDNRLLDRH